ncbi:acyltransferase family protein [Methanococcoides sp. AM1]|uniref:acyltransferase family protein n=1 Tax=Methanococcoides sp. AM1 TaxID=1201011 RepID=UPI0010829EB0|nr:acyltransferase family protein [Methanococcoides sp. AM1]
MDDKKPERRYDLDWLRVIAILAVLIFHSTRFFDPMDWDVKNNVLSENIMVLVLFIVQWLMPLFFLISGMSIYFVLSFRTKGQFIKSRFLRIMVPYLLVGIFVILPPQHYLRLLSSGESGITLLEFYSTYLTDIFVNAFPGINLPMGHLWYLYYLFVFSMVMLPIFAYLGTESGRSIISRIASIFEKSGAILLLSLPIGVLTAILDPTSFAGNPNYFGGWGILVYPIILFYGYLIASNKKLEESIQKHGKIALVLALTTFPIILWFIQSVLDGTFQFGSYGYAGVMLLRSFNMWCWMVAFLGYGKKYLNFNNSTLKYANEGLIAFYILHQTVIQIVGFFIAGWDMGIFPKYIILATTSFIAILMIYEIAIRRINIVRFLFGMKPKK